jgi:hypothetical protein
LRDEFSWTHVVNPWLKVAALTAASKARKVAANGLV